MSMTYVEDDVRTGHIGACIARQEGRQVYATATMTIVLRLPIPRC
jgi:predicted acetyltransferase